MHNQIGRSCKSIRIHAPGASRVQGIYQRLLISLAAIACLFSLTSCDDDDPSLYAEEVVEHLVEDVILPTNADLLVSVERLYSACKALRDMPTDNQQTVNAGQLWRDARAFWTMSEAYAFGPAEEFNLARELNAWPLDTGGVENLVASTSVITSSQLNKLAADMRGFHAVEYLLFRDGKTRTQDELTLREREYLEASADLLLNRIRQYAAMWAANNGFHLQLVGEDGSRQNSAQLFIELTFSAITDLCIDIDEIRLQRPLQTQNVRNVESRFSRNSLNEIRNGLLGIQHLFNGSLSFRREAQGLTAWIDTRNRLVAQRLSVRISSALTAMDNVPFPLAERLQDQSGYKPAIEALELLQQSLTDDVPPLYD